MERPFYGRTGALENARQGIPVAASRFTAGRSCKWFPSLTTVPQRVLHSITDGDGVDRSVLRFLRVACIYEELRRRHADPTRHGALLRDVLKWHQASLNEAYGRRGVGDDNSGDDLFQPYIPAYNICVLKEGKQVGLHTAVSRRAVTLVGKDRAVNDILAEHPSCSAQHAALEVHFVFAHAEEFDQQITAWMRELKVDWNSSRDIEAVCVRLREMMEELGDDESAWTMELQVLDLGSTNGTRLNGELLQPSTPVTLIEGDVLTFGCSTRRYVIVRP